MNRPMILLTGVAVPYPMVARAARLQSVVAFAWLGRRDDVTDHRQGAFEFGAPTTVAEDLTRRPAESDVRDGTRVPDGRA